MLVRLSTVRIHGSGYLDCRKCSRRVVFPDQARYEEQALIVYDFGKAQVVKSAFTLSVLHRCGQQFFWICPSCGSVPDRPFLSHRERRWNPNAHIVRDCMCGTRFEQRRLVTAT